MWDSGTSNRSIEFHTRTIIEQGYSGLSSFQSIGVLPKGYTCHFVIRSIPTKLNGSRFEDLCLETKWHLFYQKLMPKACQCHSLSEVVMTKWCSDWLDFVFFCVTLGEEEEEKTRPSGSKCSNDLIKININWSSQKFLIQYCPVCRCETSWVDRMCQTIHFLWSTRRQATRLGAGVPD